MNILLCVHGGSKEVREIVSEHLRENYSFSVLSREKIIRFQLLETADLPKEDVFDYDNILVNSCVSVLSEAYRRHFPLKLAEQMKPTILKNTRFPKRIVITDLVSKDEFDFFVFNQGTFLRNIDMTDTGVLVEDLFEYKLVLNITEEQAEKEEFTVKSDLFLVKKESDEEIISSLDIIMRGLLQDGNYKQ